LGRALALDPAIVLLEHPTIGLRRTDVATVGGDVGRVLGQRDIAALTLTGDDEFANAVARRVLVLKPGTGLLEERRRRRQWL
jgi:ABC-type polar amino acid transport system ATPase subunit